MEQAPSNI